MAAEASIIDREADLAELWQGWDELAVAARRPFCAPGWMLAWWRHMRPRRAGIRVVAVHDGGALIGIAPLWAARADRRRSRYEALAAGISSPVGPLAGPGREDEVAAAVARGLRGALPRPSELRLHSRLGGGSFAARLGASWPRRPWVHPTPPVPMPIASFEGVDFDGWLGTRRTKFRQEARRRRRHLERLGARFDLAGDADLDRAVDAFLSLHERRWQGKGEGRSNLLRPGIAAMLRDAADSLLPSERLRIFSIEGEGEIVASSVLLAAGGRVSGWSAGFDEGWHRYAPSVQLMLHAIADAIRRGESELSLGPGAPAYKSRLSDRQEEIATVSLVPRAPSYPLTRAALVPRQLRWALGERLSPDVKRTLRRVAAR